MSGSFSGDVAPAFGWMSQRQCSDLEVFVSISPTFPLKYFIFSLFNLEHRSAYVFPTAKATSSYLLCYTTQFWLHPSGSVMCPVHLGMCIWCVARRQHPLNKLLSKCGPDQSAIQKPICSCAGTGFLSWVEAIWSGSCQCDVNKGDVNHFQTWCLKSSYMNPKLCDTSLGTLKAWSLNEIAKNGV